MMRPIDIEVKIHGETDLAWLLSTTREREDAVWFPKSKISLEEGEKAFAIVTIPEWLAYEKGLI